jgi:organic hydroperoxide reductase OsmC/OhrA
MGSDREHRYQVTTAWEGNLGTGTSSYRAYSRQHSISAPAKLSAIPGSSDPAFRGDPSRYNPEELLVASLSACHMLWYLHLCADAGIVVTAYQDAAEGTMIETQGTGEFSQVTLRPRVTLADSSRAQAAAALHEEAHRLCFIARSVRFRVHVEPTIMSEP